MRSADKTYKAECIECGSKKCTWLKSFKIYLCKRCFDKNKTIQGIIDKENRLVTCEVIEEALERS